MKDLSSEICNTAGDRCPPSVKDMNVEVNNRGIEVMAVQLRTENRAPLKCYKCGGDVDLENRPRASRLCSKCAEQLTFDVETKQKANQQNQQN